MFPHNNTDNIIAEFRDYVESNPLFKIFEKLLTKESYVCIILISAKIPKQLY